MKLIVLGGSAASPYAGMGYSGYSIETATARFVLDLGPGTLPELRHHADFRTLDAIVVSHMHLDHVLDLLALRHALAYNPIQTPRPVPVWLPPGGAQLRSRAVAPFDASDEPCAFARTVRIQGHDPILPLPVGDSTVTFAAAVHYLPSWAIRVDAGGSAFGHTGDTGLAADLAGFFHGVNVLVAEATQLAPGDRCFTKRGSLTAAEAGAFGQAAAAETLVLAHLWEELGFERAAEHALSAFAGPLLLAQPGRSVEW